MPWSETARRPWILSQLRTRRDLATLPSVVDVGAGAGTARKFYGPSMPAAEWTAIEIWEPYVARFGLDRAYDRVITADARGLDPLPAAGLYLFGDVMEHMPMADAVKVWDRARTVCPLLVLTLPVHPYPQGECEGTPHEAHVAQWTVAGVLDRFAGIVAHTGPPASPPGLTAGAFIAEGDCAQGL